jgi:hypothetical protein
MRRNYRKIAMPSKNSPRHSENLNMIFADCPPAGIQSTRHYIGPSERAIECHTNGTCATFDNGANVRTIVALQSAMWKRVWIIPGGAIAPCAISIRPNADRKMRNYD